MIEGGDAALSGFWKLRQPGSRLGLMDCLRRTPWQVHANRAGYDYRLDMLLYNGPQRAPLVYEPDWSWVWLPYNREGFCQSSSRGRAKAQGLEKLPVVESSRGYSRFRGRSPLDAEQP